MIPPGSTSDEEIRWSGPSSSQHVVRSDPKEDVGIGLEREGEAVVEGDAKLPSILVALHLLHVQRRVSGVRKEKLQHLVHPALEQARQLRVLAGEARGRAEGYALTRGRFRIASFMAATDSKDPRTRPFCRSASVSRSPRCHSSVHQYFWSGSMRPALAATSASSVESPRAELRSSWILAIFARVRGSRRCSAAESFAAGALAARWRGLRMMCPLRASASRKSPTLRCSASKTSRGMVT